jgi:serine protease Do
MMFGIDCKMVGKMKKQAILFLLILMSSTFAFGENGVESAKEVEKGFSRVAREAIPAVVYIESEGVISDPVPQAQIRPNDLFNQQFWDRYFNRPQIQATPQTVLGQGSGFLVTAEGHILTNFHVVKAAVAIRVRLNDGREFPAKVIGIDPETDIAVIKIDAKELPFLKMGNSEAMEVGQWVIAIGNPLGLQTSLTVGVLSAKGRNNLSLAEFEDFLQTDAAINRGNSGGPLLNMDSEVIGINTAIASNTGGYIGIGFAIPSYMAQHVMQQLISTGKVTRGYMGIAMQPMTNDLAQALGLEGTEGALVSDVVDGSPAQKGGLQRGDVILSSGKTKIGNVVALRNHISLAQPGSEMSFTVYRNGQKVELIVMVVEKPQVETTSVAPSSALGIGMTFQTLSPEKAKSLGFPVDLQGVLIKEVVVGGPADRARLQSGQVILSVNRQRITTQEEFQRAYDVAPQGGRLLILVRTKEGTQFISMIKQ